MKKRNIFVYGPAGSGKTTLFRTLPGKKLSVVFDQSGTMSLPDDDPDHDIIEFLPDILPMSVVTLKGERDKKGKKPKEPTGYVDFEYFIEPMLEAPDEALVYNGQQFRALNEYEWVGIHSLSTLSAMVMDRVAWLHQRLGKNPEISDYLLVGNAMMYIFRSITALKKTGCFVEAHSDTTQDDTTKRIVTQIDVMKNVRRHLPKIFSEVLITRAASDAQHGAKFVVQTAPSREWYEAKNGLRLPFELDVTVDWDRPLEGQGIGKAVKEGVYTKPSK